MASAAAASPNALRDTFIGLTDSVTREIDVVCKHLSSTLASYEALQSYLPLSTSDIFTKLRDGIILGYLISHYFPGSLDPKTLVHGLNLDQLDKIHSKVTFEVNSNLNIVIAAAKSVKGLVVVNLGAEDILNGRRELILGLLWQLFSGKLLRGISIRAHPGLLMLADANETLTQFAALKPDTILLRWFNHHLRNASWAREITNFTIDLCDSELYAVLLNQLVPKEVTYDEVLYLLSIPSNNSEGNIARANIIVNFAQRISCSDFVSAEAIANGNHKLNIAFIASLFNNYSGLQLPSQTELNSLKNTVDSLHTEKGAISQKLDDTLAAKLQLENEYKGLQDKYIKEIKELRDEIEGMRSRFEAEKSAMAQEYNENILAAVENEQSSHEHILSSFTQQQEAFMEGVRSILQRAEYKVNDKAPNALECRGSGENNEPCQLIDSLSEYIESSSTRIRSLEKEVERLELIVKQKEKLNEIMGEKIKEYTEQVIVGKRTERGRRGSLLKRLFENGQS